MPRAAQEGLRLAPIQLLHAELIRPDLKDFLTPREIPLHPRVYESDFAFTPEFVDQVLVTIPKSVEVDIREVERMTGERLPVEIKGQVVKQIGEDSWGDVLEEISEDCYTDPNSKYLWVGGDPNIVLHSDISPHIGEPHRTHPMSKNKLRQYFVDPNKYKDEVGYRMEGTITWGQHNFLLGPISLQLVLRNFAIQFNNLGLQRLGIV